MYNVRYKSHHDASRSLKSKYAASVTGEAYLPNVLAGPALSRRVIYIHVPFCNKVCSFCRSIARICWIAGPITTC